MSLRGFIDKEKKYLGQLSSDQRRLLGGYFLFGLANPMILTFMQTFLWRASQDPLSIALYNLCFLSSLPIGFLLNGKLLKSGFPAQKLFFLGCALAGLGPLLLVFTNTTAINDVWMFGMLTGTSMGFFWGNRNYLTSRATSSDNRFNFISLESTLGAISSIFAPFIIGWFLVLGEKLDLYSLDLAYRLMSVVGWTLMLVVGYRVSQVSFAPVKIDRLTIGRASSLWNRLRGSEILSGFIDGFDAIFPIIITLTFIGLEESVGTIQSISAGIAALMMYYLGKRVKHKDHPKVFGFWVLVNATAKTLFVALFSPLGALLYFVVNASVASFRWPSLAAIMYEIVEQQEKAEPKSHRYALLTDRETFLNLGRAMALCLFISLYLFAPQSTLHYGFLLSILFQIALLAMVKDLTRRVTHAKETGVSAPVALDQNI